MTAEVGVLNRIGVALAADSAVTVGRSAEKIWTSADKLFQLSEIDPVGIMIYGNASFVGIPWETLIKTYRATHGSKSFRTIREHAGNFLKFLSTSRQIISTKQQDRYALGLCKLLMHGILSELRMTFNSEAEKREGLDEKDIGPLVDAIVKNRLKEIKKNPRIVGITPKDRNAVSRKYQRHLAEIRKRMFAKLPMSSATSRALSTAAIEMLTRQYFGPTQAGLVFAGFGSKQYMPALISYHIEEMVSGRPRLRPDRELIIDDDNHASVAPFAQNDMVCAFMNGIDVELFKFMRDSTAVLFQGALDKILASIEESDPKVKKRLSLLHPELQQLAEQLFKKWENSQQDYWRPVVNNIASLPKDELAAMAEAFVNLTKFRRRVTTERETVGGPIDVAVITRGDGFIWVKRKHYFDPTKNARYFTRYQGDTR